MKMKKTLLGLLSVAAVAGLASCGQKGGVKDFEWFQGHNGTPSAWPEEGNQGDQSGRQRAVSAAAAKTLCYNSRATGMIAEKITDFEGDTNQYLYLVTKVSVKVSGQDYVCDIKWDYGVSAGDAGVIKGLRYFWEDKTHAQLDFDYSKIAAGQTATVWATATIKCGDQQANQKFNYFCDLKAKTLIYDSVKISDIYKLNSAGTNFDIVDETQDYFKPNHDQKYFYCKVKGKVNYCSPDGNWGLISDGDQVMEIYAGAGTALTEEYFPALSTGYVEVVGNLSMYLGNIQIGYIYEINSVADHGDITEPTGWGEVTAELIKNAHQYTPRLMNGYYKVTGTYAGNLRDSNDKEIQPSAIVDKRFTFDLNVGDQKLKIAYDYHVDRDVTDANPGKGIFNAYKAKMQSLNVGDTLNIKGTLRYVRTEGVFKDKGYWTLVPFMADHLA